MLRTASLITSGTMPSGPGAFLGFILSVVLNITSRVKGGGGSVVFRFGLSAAGPDQSPPGAITIRPEGGDFFIPPYRLIWCLHIYVVVERFYDTDKLFRVLDIAFYNFESRRKDCFVQMSGWVPVGFTLSLACADVEEYGP
ncbi:hypothetical protein JTB14_023748 [Gonioctena quinquepunctata]|nr:hypothetical protein JTB14_023748 [Gonioctena quinquepunctata]